MRKMHRRRLIESKIFILVKHSDNRRRMGYMIAYCFQFGYQFAEKLFVFLERDTSMTTMQQGNFQKQWNQIVAKAWADDKFKQQLLANPAAVLRENGVTVPADVIVKMSENSDKVLNLTLPAKPKEELSEADLESIAGGAVIACLSIKGPPVSSPNPRGTPTV